MITLLSRDIVIPILKLLIKPYAKQGNHFLRKFVKTPFRKEPLCWQVVFGSI